VDDHLAAIVVEAHRDDVVQPGAPRVDREDERPALREMVTQDDHLAGERDRHHPPLARELGEARAADPPQLRLDERPDDRVGGDRSTPVAHHHREGRSTARVLFLWHERHLELDRGGEKDQAQHGVRTFKRRAVALLIPTP